MKLSSDFISHFDGEETVLVPVGGAAFSGIVKLNSSAAFIVDKLKEDTTEQAITDAMCETFDAPRETLERDVKKVVSQLHEIGAVTG